MTSHSAPTQTAILSSPEQESAPAAEHSGGAVDDDFHQLATLQGNQAAMEAMPSPAAPVPDPAAAVAKTPIDQPQIPSTQAVDPGSEAASTEATQPAAVVPGADAGASAASTLESAGTAPEGGQVQSFQGPDLSELDSDALAEVEAARAATMGLSAQFRLDAENAIGAMLAAAAVEVDQITAEAATQSEAIATGTSAKSDATSASFGAQRGAITAATGATAAAAQSAISADTATVAQAGSQQAGALAADFEQGSSAIGEAASAAGTTVSAATSEESGRAGSEIQTQADDVSQRGESARGSYGGDKAGPAQGEAAASVAGKGVKAIQTPRGDIAADVADTGAKATEDIGTCGDELSAAFGANAAPAVQTITDASSETTQAMSTLQAGAATQLAVGAGALLSASNQQEQGALQTLSATGEAAVVEVDAAAQTSADEILRSAQETAAGFREQTATVASTIEAIEAPDPDGAAHAFQQALGLLEQGSTTHQGNAAGGVSAFSTGIAQYGAETASALDSASSLSVAAAAQTSAQGLSACEAIATEATTQSAQGASDAVAAMTSAADETIADNAATVLAAGSGFDSAGNEGGKALKGQVDDAVQDNKSTAASPVSGQMDGVAAQVKADHDKSTIGKLVDGVVQAVKGAWNAATAVASAVASAVLNVLAFVAGAGLQVLSNMLYGLLDPLLDMVPSESFHMGRDLGERITLILSVIAIIGGLITIAAAITVTTGVGGGAAVGSGGLLALPAGGIVIAVDGALIALGAVLVAEGLIMMAAAFNNGGGTSSKHANQHRKKVANEKYLKAKAEYEELKGVRNKTKAQNAELKKLKKTMDHWKKKADFSGETHWN